MKEKGEELNLPVSKAVKKEEKSLQAYPIYPDGDDITKTYRKKIKLNDKLMESTQ